MEKGSVFNLLRESLKSKSLNKQEENKEEIHRRDRKGGT